MIMYILIIVVYPGYVHVPSRIDNDHLYREVKFTQISQRPTQAYNPSGRPTHAPNTHDHCLFDILNLHFILYKFHYVRLC